MHLQTLISILVWVGVFCSTRAVPNIMSGLQKFELAHKLNVLVRHAGWRYMEDVKILKKKRKEIVDPVSVILLDISLNRPPVDEVNVLDRHKEIWMVLMCKYGEIIFNYKVLVQHFIRVCQYEKSEDDSFRSYYDCFDLLLIKIQSMSPRLKCMTDAMDLLYSLGPPSTHKFLLPGAQKLTDYALTLRPETLAKLPERGTDVGAVDLEIKSIGEYFSEVYKKNVYWFIADHCTVSRTKNLNSKSLSDDFLYAKSIQLIPPRTTLLQFIENELDEYIAETFSKWFYNLGFTYVEGKVTIRTS